MIARNVCDSTTGKPPWDKLLDGRPAAAARAARVERHQRIDAQQEIDAFVESNGRVQRLVERAVDEVLAADVHGRKEARQRGRRLDRLGDRDMIRSMEPNVTDAPVSRFVATM
jgi:hypothetical protein